MIKRLSVKLAAEKFNKISRCHQMKLLCEKCNCKGIIASVQTNLTFNKKKYVIYKSKF